MTVEEDEENKPIVDKSAKKNEKAYYIETFKVLEEEQRSLMTESRAGHT